MVRIWKLFSLVGLWGLQCCSCGGLQCSVAVVGVAVLDLSAMLKRTLKRKQNSVLRAWSQQFLDSFEVPNKLIVIQFLIFFFGKIP